MTKRIIPFNELNAAEVERFSLLAEEASEVIYAVMKILRHGKDSSNPIVCDTDTSNSRKLATECGDFLAAMQLCFNNGDISELHVAMGKEAKLLNVGQYLHHNKVR